MNGDRSPPDPEPVSAGHAQEWPEETAPPGYVPPDPDEKPPLELWRVVGDVRPWGTLLLVLAWAGVLALLMVRGELDDGSALMARGASVAGDPALWRLLTCTFLHSGAMHLLLNSLSLAIYGPPIERIFVRGGFWIVYAAGGALASLASVAWRTWRMPDQLSYSVGASGAIFALAGALLAGTFRLRHRLARGRARALGAALLFLVAQGLSGGITRNGTDNIAHGGGLVAGIVLGAVIPFSARLEGVKPNPLWWGLGAVAATATAAALARVLIG